MASSKTQISESRAILPQVLLALLAEDLKAPVALVARLSELAQMPGMNPRDSLDNIRLVSESALKLIDAYALALKLTNLEDVTLLLEPISISAILADVRYELKSLANEYEMEIELVLPKQSAPVMTNRRALFTALTSAGASLIEALAASREEATGQTRLRLCAQQNCDRVRAGWYWSNAKIDAEILCRGGRLAATARQPLAPVTAGPASGIFIANNIFSALSSKLEPSKAHNLYGLAASIPISRQLALV